MNTMISVSVEDKTEEIYQGAKTAELVDSNSGDTLLFPKYMDEDGSSSSDITGDQDSHPIHYFHCPAFQKLMG